MALLFSDISGFTALTEKLQARGREGAEEIAAVVNRAFRPILRRLRSWGGSVFSFGGDALFVVFPGGGAVRRAVGAAEDIRVLFAERGSVRTSAGPVKLRIKQAIHFGKVHSLHLGRSDRRLHLLCGPSVQALARLEGRVEAGEILISASARRQQLRERAKSRPRTRGIRPATLRPYVPVHLLRMRREFRGEFRRVVMVFYETRGYSAARLQRFVVGLQEVLDRFGGILVSPDLSPLGTKWLCAFGAPETHEDDAVRASRASLELMGRCPPGLGFRGGMHAGAVANIWIGDGSRRSYELMGDVTNTAARTLSRAPWGEVLMTAAAKGLAADVRTQPRGSFRVKGKTRPLELHAVKGVELRGQDLRTAVPLVGRAGEMARARSMLQRALGARGGVLGLRGEPGIGKSRLCHEISLEARESGFEVRRGRAISFEGMPYWVIGALLRDMLDITSIPSEDEVLARVDHEAQDLGLDPTDRHHLAELLGVRFPDSQVGRLDHRTARVNNQLALRAFCLARAERTPLLLLFEDLHWADEASRAAIGALVEAVTAGGVTSRIMGVLTFRPAHLPPPGVEVLELAELESAEIGKLLESYVGTVSASVRDAVEERAGGNPFYVEELVRHLSESGQLTASAGERGSMDQLRAADLPARIEAVISARLDRLGADTRRVVRNASVIGRSFLLEVLERLPRMPESVRSAVAELADRQLVLPCGSDPHEEYIFKHALTRDVAYAGLLAAHRRRAHRAVADAVEAVLPDDRSYRAMLGHHRERSGQRQKARKAYREAADFAQERNALAEAAGLFESYLRLADRVGPEVVQVRLRLGHLLETTRSLEASRAEYVRARRGAVSIGDELLEAECIINIAEVDMDRGKRKLARKNLAAVLSVVERHQDGRLTARARSKLAYLDVLGEPHRAREVYGPVLALSRRVGARSTEQFALTELAAAHKQLGNRKEALSLKKAGVRFSRSIGDRRGEAVSLANLAGFYLEEGQYEESEAAYGSALAIFREMGDRANEGGVLGNLGLVYQERKDFAPAREVLGRALSLRRQIGYRLGVGYVLLTLGALELDGGRRSQAREAWTEAREIFRQLGQSRLEGVALWDLSRLERLDGRLSRAKRLNRQSASILERVGEVLELGKCYCERGHIALADGRPADTHLARAVALAEQAGVRSDSPLAREIAELRRCARG